MATRADEIKQNLASIRLPATTRLVAVSKTKPASDVLLAYGAGQRHFGENYVQELVEKAKTVSSNKCKMLSEIPNLWVVETIDSVDKAKAMNKAMRDKRMLQIFLQVNTSRESSKSGIRPEDVLEAARKIVIECAHLKLIGLMTIGSVEHSGRGTNNPDFECLLDCKAKLEELLDMTDLELSMGMSDDHEAAAAIGSTNVRVGSKIFGSRQPQPQSP